MYIRTAGFFGFILMAALFSSGSVNALGVDADLMCDPFYAQCPCNYVPDPKNPKACVYKAPTKAQDGTLKPSNTHACSVGVCQDITNKFRVRGVCIQKYKCEARLCEGNPGTFGPCSQTQIDAIGAAYNPEFKTNFILTPVNQDPIQPIDFGSTKPSTIWNSFSTDPMGSEGDPIYTNVGPSAAQEIDRLGNLQPNTDTVTSGGSSVVGPPGLYDISNPKFLEPGTPGNPSNAVSDSFLTNSFLNEKVTGFGDSNSYTSYTENMGQVYDTVQKWAGQTVENIERGAQDLQEKLTGCMTESCARGGMLENMPEYNTTIRSELGPIANTICQARDCNAEDLEKALAAVARVESNNYRGNICSASGSYCGVGQMGKDQTAESLARLERLSTNPRLSLEQQGQIREVIDSVREDLRNGYSLHEIHLDAKNSSWLWAGYVLPNVDNAVAYGQGDPTEVAKYLQLTQFTSSANNVDINGVLSPAQVRAINSNLATLNSDGTVDRALLFEPGERVTKLAALDRIDTRFGSFFEKGINAQTAFLNENGPTQLGFNSSGSTILPAAAEVGSQQNYIFGGASTFISPITSSELITDSQAFGDHFSYLSARSNLADLTKNTFVTDAVSSPPSLVDVPMPGVPDGEFYALRDQAVNAIQAPVINNQTSIERLESNIRRQENWLATLENPNGGSQQGIANVGTRQDLVRDLSSLRTEYQTLLSTLPENPTEWTQYQAQQYSDLTKSIPEIENKIVEQQKILFKDYLTANSDQLQTAIKGTEAIVNKFDPNTQNPIERNYVTKLEVLTAIAELRDANGGQLPQNIDPFIRQFNGFSESRIVQTSAYLPIETSYSINPNWYQLDGPLNTENILGISAPGLFTKYPQANVSKLLSLPSGYQSDFTNPSEIIRSTQSNISTWWQLNTPVSPLDIPAQTPFSQPTITALTLPTQGSANQLTSMLTNANNFAGLNGMSGTGGLGGFSLPSLPSGSGSGSKTSGSKTSPPPTQPPPTTVSPLPPQTQATSTPVKTAAGTIGIPDPWKGQDYKLGDDSPNIRILQKFLNSHGALVSTDGPGSQGNESTYFGEKTVAALKVFQKAQNLIETGALNVATRNRIGVISQQEEAAAANSK